jgi:hypothetical protein
MGHVRFRDESHLRGGHIQYVTEQLDELMRLRQARALGSRFFLTRRSRNQTGLYYDA